MFGTFLLGNKVPDDDNQKRPNNTGRIVCREAEFRPMRSNIAVRNHHAAGNPAQKAAAKINDDWEAIEKFQNNLAAENDEWHGHNQAKDNEQCLMSFMRLLSSTGNDMTKSATMIVLIAPSSFELPSIFS